MKTIQLMSKTDGQGVLDVHIDTGIPESPVEVVIMVGPLTARVEDSGDSDWRAFLNRFNGICADAPLERGAQGAYEPREPLA